MIFFNISDSLSFSLHSHLLPPSGRMFNCSPVTMQRKKLSAAQPSIWLCKKYRFVVFVQRKKTLTQSVSFEAFEG